MAFVLPEESTAKTPTPLADSDVRLELVPERLVAVVAFPGLVTDVEVERQRAKLRREHQGDRRREHHSRRMRRLRV